MDRILADEDFFDDLEQLPEDEQADWLFLSTSEEFKGYWEVQAVFPDFLFDFEDMIGNYRLVSPATVTEFSEKAEELGYHVAFLEDPEAIMDDYESLMAVPPVSLNSTLEGNQNGFLPWQIAGYNKLIADEDIKGGYVVWITGAGKTAFEAAAIKHHAEVGHEYDLALVVVKSHNKIDTQRKLKSLGDIDSVIIEGDWTGYRQKDKQRYKVPGPRQVLYEDLKKRLENGEQVVAVLNYEKLREDEKQICELVEGRNVLFLWDEMPTKLSNWKTRLYKSTKNILYKEFSSRPRPKWMRHWALTATPIENSPEGVYNCVRLMAPKLLGTRNQFYTQYVTGYNPFSGDPEYWHNLDKLEAKLTYMTHRVSKEDPQVKAMFPEDITMETDIDWNPKHEAIYDKLTGKAKDLLEGIEEANILALIQVMQMMCDAPSMILESATNRSLFIEALEEAESEADLPVGPKGSEIALMLINSLGYQSFTNEGHTKLETWKEIITEKHPNDKIVTHSTWANYIFPVWEECLTEWGVSYVIYNGTNKEKQHALDTFRQDDSIQMFLSGDAGADSIDIAEAPIGVNYNIPWKWTTLTQRKGRRDRVNSVYDYIYTYTLTMPNSVDERKRMICQRKFDYHQQLFDGKAIDEVFSASLSRDDLVYMLFGDQE